MGLSPILCLLRSAYLACKASILEYRLGGCDVLSPYAAELVIKRATLKGLWR